MTKSFSIVVAHDKNQGIGINNQLPWHLPTDMAYFKKLTTAAQKGKRNAVIMGRKTWESIPEKYRPLEGRFNIILTRNPKYKNSESTCKASSLEEALTFCDDSIESIFIIGGALLYKEAIVHANCLTLHVTQIDKEYNCDAFFPDYPSQFTQTQKSDTKTEKLTRFSFITLDKI
ncbi:dihydrofolate reductase [Candidatus Marinamargulisbacteria bacterium SCGC AAA071-K20]|nr:dihydrofolate reductase [Candidatus Marinamargulisbacteria bacterium SCGC AAA071-K20]